MKVLVIIVSAILSSAIGAGATYYIMTKVLDFHLEPAESIYDADGGAKGKGGMGPGGGKGGMFPGGKGKGKDGMPRNGKKDENNGEPKARMNPRWNSDHAGVALAVG
jgi:hypothetical protein